MTSNVDSQKQLAGTSVVGEASLHQPVGLPPAIHVASVMAGVLGGTQTANVQNGLPVQYGLGNDPLTHYLARMSRHQLHEVMAELIHEVQAKHTSCILALGDALAKIVEFQKIAELVGDCFGKINLLVSNSSAKNGSDKKNSSFDNVICIILNYA